MSAKSVGMALVPISMREALDSLCFMKYIITRYLRGKTPQMCICWSRDVSFLETGKALMTFEVCSWSKLGTCLHVSRRHSSMKYKFTRKAPAQQWIPMKTNIGHHSTHMQAPFDKNRQPRSENSITGWSWLIWTRACYQTSWSFTVPPPDVLHVPPPGNPEFLDFPPTFPDTSLLLQYFWNKFSFQKSPSCSCYPLNIKWDALW